MRLSILTAVCGAIDITEQWFAETVANCTTEPEVVVVSNGNTEEELDRLASWLPVGGKLVVEASPLGSTRAFNRGLPSCTGDVVAMLHNDLMVHDPGWDATVLACFEAWPELGVAGFHGSLQLGSPELYQSPFHYEIAYELSQLARGRSVSNLDDAEAHGARRPFPTQVVTLDGMALIARRADLVAWGGFDERYVHHQYDHDLCTTARMHGRYNCMIPIRAKHISGQTANASRYQEALGPDHDAHRDAHIAFYEKWKGTGLLPAGL